MEYIKELEKQNEELKQKLSDNEKYQNDIIEYYSRLSTRVFKYTLSVAYADPKGANSEPTITIPVSGVGECFPYVERFFEMLPVRCVFIKRISLVDNSVLGFNLFNYNRGHLNGNYYRFIWRPRVIGQKPQNIQYTDVDATKKALLVYLKMRYDRECRV
jgi:hypothetical protein